MKKVFCIAALIALTGCASHPPLGTITPLDGGTYHVEATGETRDDAQKSALYSAESTCAKQHARHVVTDQQMAYKGLLQEDTGQTFNKVASIASAAGLSIPSLSSDDDYRATLRFRCEH